LWRCNSDIDLENVDFVLINRTWVKAELKYQAIFFQFHIEYLYFLNIISILGFHARKVLMNNQVWFNFFFQNNKQNNLFFKIFKLNFSLPIFFE
jgi:hypothetical protein